VRRGYRSPEERRAEKCRYGNWVDVMVKQRPGLAEGRSHTVDE
jgi:hypothetical protein